MRRSLSIVAVALMMSLTGCSTPERHEVALTVIPKPYIALSQRNAIEQKLRNMPRTRDFSIETREQAYEKFKQEFKDDPDILAQVKPGSLPESFHVTVTDGSVAEAMETAMLGLPGVGDVVVVPAELVERKGAAFIVQVREDATSEERAAVEATIHDIPQVGKVTFESREDAYTRLRASCVDEPALAEALDDGKVFGSYRFTAGTSSLGSKPVLRLDQLGGVRAVLRVWASAL